MLDLGNRISVYQPEQEGLKFPEEPKLNSNEEIRLDRKKRLVAACRAFAQQKFDYGFAGHLTIRDPEHPELYWTNPMAVHFDQVKLSNLILVDHKGKVIEGDYAVNQAGFVLHGAVHEEHPDILARLVPQPDMKDIVRDAVAACRATARMTVTSLAGTDLEIDITDMPTVGVWGWTDRPGTLAHWPGGLVVGFPREGCCNGRIVFAPGDMNLTFKRYFESEVSCTVRGDFITDITGSGADARLMKTYLDGFADPLAFATSHVGWGLNPAARYEALAMYDREDINGTEFTRKTVNISQF